MKKRDGGFWVGVSLLLLGLLVLVGQLDFFGFSWDIACSLIVLAIGLCFHIAFATGGGRSPGILVPGGILLSYGLLFFASSVLGGRVLTQLWPVFILGPGIGLLELYFFSTKPRDHGLLIPVGILFALGGTMLVIELIGIGWEYFLPIALIATGVLLLFLSIMRKRAPTVAVEERAVPAARAGMGPDDDFMSAPSYRPVTPIAPPAPIAPPVPGSPRIQSAIELREPEAMPITLTLGEDQASEEPDRDISSAEDQGERDA